MAKKVTKVTSKKKVTKKNIKRKNIQPNKDENSVGIIMLVTVGLILLIYFATNVNIDIEEEVSVGEKNAKIEQESVDQPIIISGKSYSSKTAAKKQLQFMPQSELTDEEIKFIEGY